MNIENIIKKYNYSKPISTFLYKAYPLFVEYFQDEVVVYKALNSAEIVLTDDMSKYLYDNDFFDEEDRSNFNEFDVLNECFGSYCSNPVLKYNHGTYKITDIKRVVLINTTLTDEDNFASTLAHELCHLIKSINTDYIIKEDTLTEYCGFRTIRYELTFNNRYVLKRPIFEHGVGIEEGLNTVAGDEIASKIYTKTGKYIGYDYIKKMAQKIIDTFHEFKQNIINAELNHSLDELDKLFGINFYKLIDLFDKVIEIDDEYLMSINNELKKREIEKKANYIYVEMFIPILSEIKKNYEGKGSVRNA